MKWLVTAGPTREAIDPVRYLSNRSSGKMGFAIARAAVRRGHAVVLVSGPVALKPPRGVTVVNVLTAAQMLAAVRRALPRCDALVMAAAVADYRPRQAAPLKLKKTRARLTLDLVRTPDILATIRPLKGRRLVVGFAAETHDMEPEALRKLRAKGLDLVVANDVSRADAGFEVDTNRVTLLGADGSREAWPLMTKTAVAGRLVRRIERLAAARRALRGH